MTLRIYRSSGVTGSVERGVMGEESRGALDRGEELGADPFGVGRWDGVAHIPSYALGATTSALSGGPRRVLRGAMLVTGAAQSVPRVVQVTMVAGCGREDGQRE